MKWDSLRNDQLSINENGNDWISLKISPWNKAFQKKNKLYYSENIVCAVWTLNTIHIVHRTLVHAYEHIYSIWYMNSSWVEFDDEHVCTHNVDIILFFECAMWDLSILNAYDMRTQTTTKGSNDRKK